MIKKIPVEKRSLYLSLINSRRWQMVRRAKLRKNPLCERCLSEENRSRPASEVHHIKPVEGASTPDEAQVRAYDPTNLMSVCRECHYAIHKALRRNARASRKEVDNAKTKSFIENFLEIK